MENYRPVSLSSQVCKLLEVIIRDTLVYHLKSNQLIVNSQHGFRKGRSCLTNLLEFLNKVTGCVDIGDNVDVIFLDFAKKELHILETILHGKSEVESCSSRKRSRNCNI